jgi:hypothetical protein
LGGQNRPFCFFFFLNNKSHAIWSRELFGKFAKKLPHFKEESYEIVKIFGGFGQFFSSFLKSPYLANSFSGSPTCNKIPRFFASQILSCNQIWLNPVLADYHF